MLNQVENGIKPVNQTQPKYCQVVENNIDSLANLNNEHINNINNYYDSPAVQLFESFFNQQIHLGYWDDKYPNINLEQAASRLTQVVLSYIAPPKYGSVIDIGCGCGTVAIDIARSKQCFVSGVTVNAKQKSKADDLITKTNLTRQVQIQLADACALPYQDNCFDSALLLESIHHIGHHDALSEVHRVLKQGGEVIIADGAAVKESAEYSKRVMLRDIFVAKQLVTAKELLGIMQQIGFEVVEQLDLTEAILPTWSKLIRETERHENRIIAEQGQAFFDELIHFWAEIRTLWKYNARYLLYKGRKL